MLFGPYTLTPHIHITSCGLETSYCVPLLWMLHLKDQIHVWMLLSTSKCFQCMHDFHLGHHCPEMKLMRSKKFLPLYFVLAISAVCFHSIWSIQHSADVKSLLNVVNTKLTECKGKSFKRLWLTGKNWLCIESSQILKNLENSICPQEENAKEIMHSTGIV